MIPTQQRQRDMMGAAWQKKKRDDLEKKRKQFNQQQIESERRTAEAQKQQKNLHHAQHNHPFGDAAWRGNKITPANSSTPLNDIQVSPTEKPKGIVRRLIGIVALLVALPSGALALFGIFLSVLEPRSAPNVLQFLLVVVVFGLSFWVAKASFRTKRSTGRSVDTARDSNPVQVRGNLVGEVRGVQRRMEADGNKNLEVLSFRVERYDTAGNRLHPVEVEMRGSKFKGSLQEGDQVLVKGKRSQGQSRTASVVKNLTTQTVVKAKKPWTFLSNLLWFAFISALIFVLISFLSSL